VANRRHGRRGLGDEMSRASTVKWLETCLGFDRQHTHLTPPHPPKQPSSQQEAPEPWGTRGVVDGRGGCDGLVLPALRWELAEPVRLLKERREALAKVSVRREENGCPDEPVPLGRDHIGCESDRRCEADVRAWSRVMRPIRISDEEWSVYMQGEGGSGGLDRQRDETAGRRGRRADGFVISQTATLARARSTIICGRRCDRSPSAGRAYSTCSLPSFSIRARY